VAGGGQQRLVAGERLMAGLRCHVRWPNITFVQKPSNRIGGKPSNYIPKGHICSNYVKLARTRTIFQRGSGPVSGRSTVLGKGDRAKTQKVSKHSGSLSLNQRIIFFHRIGSTNQKRWRNRGV